MAGMKVENIVNDLIQLDIDAQYAYIQAIDAIKEQDIRNKLNDFKNDHDRHVRELSTLLRKEGMEPIKATQDLKGYVIEGMTKIVSMAGTFAALKAMLGNEKLTNKKYEEALGAEGFSEAMRELLQRNLADEKRHYEYIQSKLEDFD